MKYLSLGAALASVLILAGCATTPQKPKPLIN